MSVWANQAKNSDSFTNQSKNLASFNNQSKNTATYSNQSKLSGIFYLLQEISNYILQENGGRIILQESIDWGNTTKNSAVFTNLAKS